MERHKFMTADDILERIFDWENDFKDMNEFHSDFEPDSSFSTDVMANESDKPEESIVD